MVRYLEMGLDSFGDVTAGADGQLLPHAQVIRDVIEEAVLADQLGVDFIGLGEHHRDDPGCGIRRAGGGHPRPWLLHRILPALRL
jgi:alkanesulfonate monooxygenase SsuD/methylene tetrahydromethanopterin reductase-like flavin-dependent oxidoreductase (luciferase family)